MLTHTHTHTHTHTCAHIHTCRHVHSHVTTKQCCKCNQFDGRSETPCSKLQSPSQSHIWLERRHRDDTTTVAVVKHLGIISRWGEHSTSILIINKWGNHACCFSVKYTDMSAVHETNPANFWHSWHYKNINVTQQNKVFRCSVMSS